MRRSLFAERFTWVPEAELAVALCYDEQRGLSLTTDGRPFVEVHPTASTHTMTRADAEPADSDRAWDSVMGVGTLTKARRDRDHW